MNYIKNLLILFSLLFSCMTFSQQPEPLPWDRYYTSCPRDKAAVWELPDSIENKIKWSPETTKEQKTIIRYILSNMVYVEGGDDIRLGSDKQYLISLSSFFMNRYEVSQDEWFVIMGDKPSNRLRRSYPVDQISWARAIDFVNKLQQLSGLPFNIPSEAQWEYAAKGGKYTQNYIYSGSDKANEVAWFKEHSFEPCISEPSGRKKPNELGIYDMSGNLYEWCLDYYSEKPFSNDGHDPVEVELLDHKVLRGGSFYTPAMYCRVTNRYGVNPQRWDIDYGVRLVLLIR